MTIHKCDWCESVMRDDFIKIRTNVIVAGRHKNPLYAKDLSLSVYDDKEYDICPACFEQFMRTRFIKMPGDDGYGKQ